MIARLAPKRRRSAPPRALAALAVLALAPTLAACGDSQDSAAKGFKAGVLTAKDLANVADRTAARGGVRMSLAQTLSLADHPQIALSAQGVFDSKTKRGEMTLSTALPDGAAADAGELRQHMIFDDTTIYISSPGLASLAGAKTWMKIDLAKVGKQAGIDFGALVQGGGQDPRQVLQYLKSASGDVTRVGTETVRGQPTTHYKATIDFDKVPDAAPADQRDAIRKSIRQIIQVSGTSKAPIEVWIGDDGAARRIADDITTNVGGQRARIVQRIELYDFGTKVDVQPPPASETADIGDLGSPDRSSASGIAVPR